MWLQSQALDGTRSSHLLLWYNNYEVVRNDLKKNFFSILVLLAQKIREMS